MNGLEGGTMHQPPYVLTYPDQSLLMVNVQLQFPFRYRSLDEIFLLPRVTELIISMPPHIDNSRSALSIRLHQSSQDPSHLEGKYRFLEGCLPGVEGPKVLTEPCPIKPTNYCQLSNIYPLSEATDTLNQHALNLCSHRRNLEALCAKHSLPLVTPNPQHPTPEHNYANTLAVQLALALEQRYLTPDQENTLVRQVVEVRQASVDLKKLSAAYNRYARICMGISIAASIFFTQLTNSVLAAIISGALAQALIQDVISKGLNLPETERLASQESDLQRFFPPPKC